MFKPRETTDKRNMHLKKAGDAKQQPVTCHVYTKTEGRQIYNPLIRVWSNDAGFGEHVHIFKNTTGQLNIPLSRHSYLLDQCYYYSLWYKKRKIQSDCPFKAASREAGVILRHRAKAMIVNSAIDFYKMYVQPDGAQSRQWACWSVTEESGMLLFWLPMQEIENMRRSPQGINNISLLCEQLTVC